MAAVDDQNVREIHLSYPAILSRGTNVLKQEASLKNDGTVVSLSCTALEKT